MRSAIAAALALATLASWIQRPEPFVPVGVVMGTAGGVTGDRRDLQQLVRRRFNVVAFRSAATRELRFVRLADLLAPGSRERMPELPANDIAVVSAHKTPRELRLQSWRAVANGSRGVVFDPAPALVRNPAAFDAASSFADNVTRNAALFAPLRPRESTADIRVDVGASIVDARFLESRDALVLIAMNQTESVHRATMTFSREMPEAIWQNMESGAAVNFVAGAGGPTYTRTFTPYDVLVLMIRKQYK